ncbi:hypothetical protein ASF27_20895 [Methylobacterium sp. Leaf102]|nr:hypothetical protein ASF27_20895 [Methylobacterium sp. Leaf102]
MRPAARREVAGHLQVAYDISERRACLATGFGRSSQRYRKRSDPQVALRMRLKEMAAARVRYGYRRLHILLRREIRRLEQLADENGKLKRLVADLTLDRSMLQDVLKDQWWGPPFAVRSRVIYRWPTTSASVGPVWLPASAVRPSATGSARTLRSLCGCG